MLILVQIDISSADLAAFERYEQSVLALLPRHGGRVIERLRSADGRTETHLLHFPSEATLDEFRRDPDRVKLQDLWLSCGASSAMSEVVRVGEISSMSHSTACT